MANLISDDDLLELLFEEDSDDPLEEVDSDAQSESSDDGEIDHLSTASFSSSDVSDVEEIEDANSSGFTSKNKKEYWSATPYSSNTGRIASCNIFRERAGPTRYARAQCDSVVESFKLFFRRNLVEKVRNWTNIEGLLVYKANWITISQAEFEKFLGIVILIGVYKSNSENVSQLWSKEDGRPIFNKLMSRNRYQQILRVLRFDDASSRRRNRSTDKLQPIRDVFEEWDLNLRDAYTPGPHMTVDEQLVCFRGRCPFRQYIPSKPGKYGIKVWAICEANTSYAWKMQVYTGKNPAIGREVNQGARVVKDLVKEIENSGRNITCDNFFTSVPLARELLKKNLTLVGTIRKNKPELPQKFTVAKDREVESTIFGFQKDVLVASYCPKKAYVVNMLSTMHSLPEIVSNSAGKKPEVILYYNKTKSGVDTLDRMVRTYTSKRMTRRWPVVLFYNMIDVSGVNAFVLWQQLQGETTNVFSKKKRRNFLMQLGKELAGLSSSSSTATRHATLQPNKRKVTAPEDQARKAKKTRCCLCERHKDRKCRQTCFACKRNVCQEHSQLVCDQCKPE